MQRIKLNRQSWEFDDTAPLGSPGGFGQVFACPPDVAIKRLNVSPEYAKRELTLAETLADRTLSNVVPVLDAGQDADTGRHYIVMARCEMSLQDHWAKVGILPLDEAIKILKDILTGLKEVGDIVHRDLKPANILLHQGMWKIADFGIARFVEDTTSLNTMRDCLSPPYAAPEQWLNVRVTKATDLYAWACIAHQLLSGDLPFAADDKTEWQSKHLNHAPSELPETIPGKLRSLLSLMLRKQPDLRPSLDRAMAILNDTERAPRIDLSFLQHVDAKISADDAAKEAADRQKAELKRQNDAITSTANLDIPIFRDRLFALIKEATANFKATEWTIALGAAEIGFEPPKTGPVKFPLRFGSWEVFASSAIGIRQSRGHIQEMSANLLFCRLHEGEELRWRQMSFMPNPDGMEPRRFRDMQNLRNVPFSIELHSTSVTDAFHRHPPKLMMAENTKAIDGEDFDKFAKLWLDRFGRAAAGEQFKPTSYPIPDTDRR